MKHLSTILLFLFVAACTSKQNPEPAKFDPEPYLKEQAATNAYILAVIADFDSLVAIQGETLKKLTDRQQITNLAIKQFGEQLSRQGTRDIELQLGIERTQKEIQGIALVVRSNVKRIENLERQLAVSGNKDQSLADQIAELGEQVNRIQQGIDVNGNEIFVTQSAIDSLKLNFDILVEGLKKNQFTRTIFK